MTYFVLWIYIIAGGVEWTATGTHTSLTACLEEAVKTDKRFTSAGRNTIIVCLPAGTYPVVPGSKVSP